MQIYNFSQAKFCPFLPNYYTILRRRILPPGAYSILVISLRRRLKIRFSSREI